jgi:anti-sigma factor RsiW
MVDCQQFLAEYSALRDGELPFERMIELEVHRDECPACAHYDDVVSRGASLLREAPELEPSDEFTERLMGRISDVEREMAWDRRTRASLAGTVTIAALLAAAVWTPLFRSDAPSLPSMSASPPRLEGRFSDDVGFDGAPAPGASALRDRGLSAQLSDLGVPVVDTPYRDLVFRQTSLAASLAAYAAEAAPAPAH